MDLARATIVDLTQPWGPVTATWPGDGPIHVTTTATVADDGYFARRLDGPEHAGTHLDAPAHFLTTGRSAVEIPVTDLIRPLVVIDVADRIGDDPDAEVGVDAIRAAEDRDGPIAAGDIVVIHTGWDRHVTDPERYIGRTHPRCPGIDLAAAEHLVDRGIVGLGIDTMSVERGGSPDFPVHQLTLGHGIWHLEGLVGIDRVPRRGAWLIVAPLALTGGSGAPTRVLAVVDAAA